MPHRALLSVLLSSIMAAFLAGWVCRFTQARQRRADWSIGLIGAVAGAILGVFTVGLLSVLFIYHANVFHLESWGRDKPPLWLSMLTDSFLSFAVGFVAAILVVGYYRRRFRDVDPAA